MKRILTTIIILSALTESYGQCSASFTSSFVSEYHVQFIPADSSLNKLHTWYYGDSTYDTYTYGNRSYERPGTYTVKHVIYDSVTHCKDSVTQTINLSYTPQCYAIIYFQRGFPDANTYYFQSGSYGIGTTIIQYTWKINGQIVGNDSYLNYTFTSFGEYEVCLEIKTKSGCTSSVCETINSVTKCDLAAGFTYTADKSNSRLIYFQPDHYDSRFRYRFLLKGTGEIYNSYFFSAPGEYEVTMFVTDSIHHCYDSSIQLVNVHANCYDSLSVVLTAANNPNIPNQVIFTPTSNQPIVHQLWKIYFIDNLLDSIENTFGTLTYTFPDTGSYKISATLLTKNGCSKEYTQYVYIDAMGNYSSRQSIVGYPNPAGNEVTLPFNATISGPIKITVYNVMGKPVITRQETLVQGNNQIRIPVQQLNKGQYYIDIFYNGKRIKSVFQKL